MKLQFLLIGAVAVLSLGAVTLDNAVLVGSASHGRSNSPSASPSSQQSQAPEATETPESEPSSQDSPGTTQGVHPCNHGFYVSQAAHAHKGGAYTSQIARSDIGKNGDCSQPLPTPNTTG